MKVKAKSKKTTKKRARPRRKLTEAQEQARDERRTKLDALVEKVLAMTPEQREEMIERVGAVVTCGGRVLSEKNTCLILEQAGENPVSMVGGFMQWRELHGRTVMRNQHGYVILVPKGKKDGDGTDDPDERVRFIPRYVFDITQTEPLPPKEEE